MASKTVAYRRTGAAKAAVTIAREQWHYGARPGEVQDGGGALPVVPRADPCEVEGGDQDGAVQRNMHKAGVRVHVRKQGREGGKG